MRSIKNTLIRASLLFAAQCVFLVTDTAAHPGWGIVVDRRGQIYFGDVETNTVWRLNLQGRLEAVATDKHSHSLFMDERETLYGEHVYYDNGAQRWISGFWKLMPDGEELFIVPMTANPPKGSGFFMDAEGNIYSVHGGASDSSETRLLKRTPDGSVVVIAGGERGHADGRGSDARFNNITGMAWGPDGSLYVTDSSCVRRLTVDGAVTTVGGNPLASLARSGNPRLLGLAVNSAGVVYIADYDYHCVRKLYSDGRTEVVLDEGFFWSPSGVTAVGDDLYVLEHHPESLVAFLTFIGFGPYARVRRISSDGAITTLTTLWGRNTVAISAALATIVGLIVFWRARRSRRRAGSNKTGLNNKTRLNNKTGLNNKARAGHFK